MTILENKMQLIDIISNNLVETFWPTLNLSNIVIVIVSGRYPVTIELFRGYQSHRADLRTTHEEADVTMVHQVVHLDKNGVQTIKSCI